VFHRRALLGYEALAPGFVKKLQGAIPGFSPAGEDRYRADLPSGTLWLLSRERYHLGLAGKATRAQAEAILSDLDGRAVRWLSGQR